MGSILYIRKCPPQGGDTLFASMYAAYEALSDRMKAYLDGLTARHNGEHLSRPVRQLRRRRTRRATRAPSTRWCAPTR